METFSEKASAHTQATTCAPLSTVTLRFRCQRTRDTRVPSWFRNQESNLDLEHQRLASYQLDDSEIASVRRESHPRRSEQESGTPLQHLGPRRITSLLFVRSLHRHTSSTRRLRSTSAPFPSSDLAPRHTRAPWARLELNQLASKARRLQRRSLPRANPGPLNDESRLGGTGRLSRGKIP